jgi:hypothetical protein
MYQIFKIAGQSKCKCILNQLEPNSIVSFKQWIFHWDLYLSTDNYLRTCLWWLPERDHMSKKYDLKQSSKTIFYDLNFEFFKHV